MKRIYFIGIGGIGMSALARWYIHNGYIVAGYDRTSTTLTQKLEAEGMHIHYEDGVQYIPTEYINDKSSWVIYTPAVGAAHQELQYFQKEGYKVMKRAEALGEISKQMPTYGISGTHGKTTTTAMLSHLLMSHQAAMTAFVGGIMVNYQTNLLLHKDEQQEEVMVVEADEFDRSFLHLQPYRAVMTSVDADHLDIYGNHNAVLDSFAAFAEKVKDVIFAHVDVVKQMNSVVKAKWLSYGIEEGDIQAQNLRIEEGAFVFDYVSTDITIRDLKLYTSGFHNVCNALAAISMALSYGMSGGEVKEALLSFKGVKRRFEWVYKGVGKTFIDDYAHHPSEIASFLSSVKAIFPSKKIAAIFQPHLYSRTRDFENDFAHVLSGVDQLYLLPIYPAREQPIEGVTSERLASLVQGTEVQVLSKQDCLAQIEQNVPDLLLTMGAGDIDRLVPQIEQMYQQKSKS